MFSRVVGSLPVTGLAFIIASSVFISSMNAAGFYFFVAYPYNLVGFVPVKFADYGEIAVIFNWAVWIQNFRNVVIFYSVTRVIQLKNPAVVMMERSGLALVFIPEVPRIVILVGFVQMILVKYHEMRVCSPSPFFPSSFDNREKKTRFSCAL